MKNETYLPLFSGFYNTMWEFQHDYIDEFIQNERNQKGLYSCYNGDDVKIDYTSYENDIVKFFAEDLQEKLFEYNFISKIKVQKIIHPKYYNFSNDSVDISIEYNQETIKDFIYARHKAFCEFLKRRYTSCDGFISYYSNNFETWENETSHFSDFSKNGHMLGSILDFICNELKIYEFSIYENVMENIYALNYAENLDDIINKLDGSLSEYLTSKGISKDYADYIQNTFENGFINELSLNENILSLIREWQESLIEA